MHLTAVMRTPEYAREREGMCGHALDCIMQMLLVSKKIIMK
jgi:hypothetical protein